MDRRDALVETFMDAVEARAPGEPEFTQAVEEVARDVITVERAHSDWSNARVLERLTVPDRIIAFRIDWRDDSGAVRVNRGWRVQACNVLGPYKGGLRFHPSVTRSVLKFLAFEQCFKNALSGLPLGGAKGGSDFDPSGCSPAEIERFCTAFMTELAHHIGPQTDVPAGDINVGPHEIGLLYGTYLRQRGQWQGALTGKGTSFGGSALRIEATGYGLIYFVCEMLGERGASFEGQRVAISGMGNVALHAAEKAMEMGARVVALSDSSGVITCEDGIGRDALRWLSERKAGGEAVSDPPSEYGLDYAEGGSPWRTDCDIALPCATQNEIGEDAARALIDGPCTLLAEGANMPLTAKAQTLVRGADMDFAPGKAANAGGVAVSGLEMSQNAHFRYLDRATVDAALRDIMGRIHDRLRDEADRGDAPEYGGRIDYARAANVAAYRQLAQAIAHLGV